MKTTVALLILLILFSLNSVAQEHPQFNLPQGAKARLGKGSTTGVAYSPDGTRLAVPSSIGIWLYDAHTGVEVDLLSGQDWFYSVSFSPDGKILAAGGYQEIRLWDAVTGAPKQAITGHTDWIFIVDSTINNTYYGEFYSEFKKQIDINSSRHTPCAVTPRTPIYQGSFIVSH